MNARPIHTSTPRAFQRTVYRYFAAQGRDFPWRRNPSPYAVLISEYMLQQTQTDRVVPKYRAFLREFPSCRALACARRADVLAAWQGLGYNRRAKHLHEAAQIIHAQYAGRVPATYDELVALPGIGPYTAAAIQAFAFDLPSVFVETNIRTALIHHFCPNATRTPEKELLALAEQVLDRDQPRRWYSALMDYGAHIKAVHGNLNTKSERYTKQSRFEGSTRQLRGAIIRILTEREGATVEVLARHASRTRKETRVQVDALIADGLVTRKGNTVSLI